MSKKNSLNHVQNPSKPNPKIPPQVKIISPQVMVIQLPKINQNRSINSKIQRRRRGRKSNTNRKSRSKTLAAKTKIVQHHITIPETQNQHHNIMIYHSKKKHRSRNTINSHTSPNLIQNIPETHYQNRSQNTNTPNWFQSKPNQTNTLC